MANSNFKSLRAPHDAICVAVFRGDWGFRITYRSPSRAALLAAECITQFMIDQLNDPSRRHNDPRGRVDAEGARFRLLKRPTKSEPDRCVLYRSICFNSGGGEARALALPGVADNLRAQQPAPGALPRINTAARGIAETSGVTCVAERTRAVGRFRRMVSWATDGKLISPDWQAIHVRTLADRLGVI